MDEEKIKKIAEEVAQKVYDTNQSTNQFNLSKISNHIHNGVDAKRISQDDVEAGTYALFGFNSVASEIFTIETFPNIDTITLHGIAADGLGRKASFSGSAFIGNCFQFGSATGNYFTLKGSYADIIQSSSSAYFDTTFTDPATEGTFNTTNVRVNATGSAGIGGVSPAIVYVKDAVNEVAVCRIIKWTETTITFQTILAANWSITAFVTLS